MRGILERSRTDRPNPRLVCGDDNTVPSAERCTPCETPNHVGYACVLRKVPNRPSINVAGGLNGMKAETDQSQACSVRLHSSSTMASISTGTFSGNALVPTAERAWTPFSPNTAANKSLAPFTT
jgi:hypothetical protein